MKGSILLRDTKERIELDRKNQLILQMLFDNSRVPITKIAKKIGLSKPATLQRLKQMKERGIILQYLAYFNLIDAGWRFYAVMIEASNENEDSLIKKFENHKNSAAVIKLASKYNIFWMVYSKTYESFNEILEQAGGKIKDVRVLPIEENFFDNYRLFDNNEKKLKEISKTKFKLDKTDAKILNSIKHNSGKSLVEISKSCNLSAEAIKHRMKRLESSGTILKYFTNVDIFKLGFHPYVVLLKTNRKKQKEIFEFVRSYHNTNGQYLLDHEFSIMCVLVSKNLNELRDFLDSLQEKFSGEILEHETHLITDQFLSDFFPEGIYSQYK
ncbi:MAG: winged helix-turn-helix transcriptional regulator [archaeon]